MPKSKWVPLEIDLPKARGKPRERNNNNVSGNHNTTSAPKRREIEPSDELNEARNSTRRYRSTSSRSGNEPIKARHSGPLPNNSSSRNNYVSNSSSNSTRPRAPTHNGSHPKRGGVGGSIRSSGNLPKSRPRTAHQYPQNGEYPAEWIVTDPIVKNRAGIEAAQQIILPYIGTYYYNGVPSYANLDTSSLKEAIRKQV